MYAQGWSRTPYCFYCRQSGGVTILSVTPPHGNVRLIQGDEESHKPRLKSLNLYREEESDPAVTMKGIAINIANTIAAKIRFPVFFIVGLPSRYPVAE